MIKIQQKIVKIKCLECHSIHDINLKHFSTEKEQRALGYEYEHIYKAEHKCQICSDAIELIIEIYEYPKNFINSHNIINNGCISLNDFSTDINKLIIK